MRNSVLALAQTTDAMASEGLNCCSKLAGTNGYYVFKCFNNTQLSDLKSEAKNKAVF
jgi:hypothetical protein